HGAAVAGRAADTVIVAPEEFQMAIGPWIERRRSEGRVVAIVDSDRRGASSIRSEIQNMAKGGRLRFVVLVGDALSSDGEAQSSSTTPTFRLPAKVNRAWG